MVPLVSVTPVPFSIGRLVAKLDNKMILVLTFVFDVTAACVGSHPLATLAPTFSAWSTPRLAVTFGVFVASAIASLWAVRMYEMIGAGAPVQWCRLVIAAGLANLLLPAIVLFAGFSADGLTPWLFGNWASMVIALGAARIGIFLLSRSSNRSAATCRVAIIGATDVAGQIQRLAANSSAFTITGVFDDRHAAGGRIAPMVVSGTVADLLVQVQDELVDHVLIALPLTATSRVADLAGRFQAFPIDVTVGLDHFALALPVKGVEQIGGASVLTLYKNPLDPGESILKRIEDLLIAGLLLVVLAPLLALTALIIKLESPGPVLFKQRRHGYRNRIFEVYKFRTMYAEAADLAGHQLTQAEDPRITPVGRFLRKFSVDELPQLFNVIKGDMAMVGPRPHALAASAGGVLYTESADNYALRQRVKPGITGWAQVNGWRGPTETLEQIRARLAHDIYYTENYSIGFDLAILFRTPLAVLVPPPTAY